jgi:hypothetical protein
MRGKFLGDESIAEIKKRALFRHENCRQVHPEAELAAFMSLAFWRDTVFPFRAGPDFLLRTQAQAM